MVIVGGVAGGASTATRLRRNSEEAENMSLMPIAVFPITWARSSLNGKSLSWYQNGILSSNSI